MAVSYSTHTHFLQKKRSEFAIEKSKQNTDFGKVEMSYFHPSTNKTILIYLFSYEITG